MSYPIATTKSVLAPALWALVGLGVVAFGYWAIGGRDAPEVELAAQTIEVAPTLADATEEPEPEPAAPADTNVLGGEAPAEEVATSVPKEAFDAMKARALYAEKKLASKNRALNAAHNEIAALHADQNAAAVAALPKPPPTEEAILNILAPVYAARP